MMIIIILISFQYGEKVSTKKLSKLYDNPNGKWIGLIKLSNKGSILFNEHIEKFIDLNGKDSMMEDFINYLINKKINVTSQIVKNDGYRQ